MIDPQRDRPQAILIVRLFGRVRCVFCDRRIDRLIVDQSGVRTVHQERDWRPCDDPNPPDHRTGAVRPSAPVRLPLAAHDSGLATRRSA